MEFSFRNIIISSLCHCNPFAFNCASRKILFGLMGLVDQRGKHV